MTLEDELEIYRIQVNRIFMAAEKKFIQNYEKGKRGWNEMHKNEISLCLLKEFNEYLFSNEETIHLEAGDILNFLAFGIESCIYDD